MKILFWVLLAEHIFAGICFAYMASEWRRFRVLKSLGYVLFWPVPLIVAAVQIVYEDNFAGNILKAEWFKKGGSDV